jgi:hypothetical protein
MEQSKKTRKTSPEALFYYIKNTGKATLGLIQDVVPRIKKFDKDVTRIGINADKINKKKTAKSKKTSKTNTTSEQAKQDFKVLS